MRLWQLLQPFAVLGRDRSCFSLFQALKPAKAISAQEPHNSWGREKKACCWPELSSVFLNNSTCVLVLGRGVYGASTSPCTVRREAGRRPLSSRLSAFVAARPPQAGTCCGCQPEGLKFLQLAEPMLKLGKQKGERMAAPAKAGRPTPLYSGSPVQLLCHNTG